ncbi:MAG TPA: Crp/Fnr family transcriptional regulator [Dongiaceae bacterium]|jgi:CRP-like cAMP-binding protein|nr:Crp/Fnr family transcriptional regulator [Dongiaceae bacterium]
MAGTPSHPTANRVLSRLSASDFALLHKHLQRVDLPLRKSLEVRNKAIDYVYFPESGFASVVAKANGGQSIEVGLIGREGMTGIAIIMGTDRTPQDTFMQNAGKGWRIATGKLRQAMEQSRSLHQAFLLYGHAYIVQSAYTAMTNGRNKIEERLARWILMARDRIDGEQLSLTHEFLAMMLGVRRPGVTVALNLLEQIGLIRAARGKISIIDRKGLEKISNGAYGEAEAEFNRLFG